MGANLSRVFVVDIESTCWETPEEQGNKPNEVIEIGICELDVRTTDILNKRSYVAKPRSSEVSPFCTKLTGWTQAAVDKGADIELVLRTIAEDYRITKNHVWCSYGEYDRVMLTKAWEDSRNPFRYMRAHYNIKTLMALREGLDRELGMARALNHYGEDLDGRHHSGVDDAFNIAKLARIVLLNATTWKSWRAPLKAAKPKAGS